MKNLLLFFAFSLLTINGFSQTLCNGKISLSVKNATCRSGNDGGIFITSAPTEMHQFQLLKMPSKEIIQDFTSEKTFNFLLEGDYRVVCKDTLNNTCFEDVKITEPTQLKILLGPANQVTATQPIRNLKNGQITIDFIGGNGPYLVHINNLDKTYNRTFSIGMNNRKTIDSLGSSTYTIIVEDRNKCQSQSLQYDLNAEENYNFSYVPPQLTCLKTPEYKIKLWNGSHPFKIDILYNNVPYINTSLDQDGEFIVPVSEYGMYKVAIEDNRHISRVFPIDYKKLNCNIYVSTKIITPNTDNKNGGKFQVHVLNEIDFPFTVTLTDLTTQKESQQVLHSKAFEFNGLAEGSYRLVGLDKLNRKIDTSFNIFNQIPNYHIAKKDFEKSKNIFYRDFISCKLKKNRVENLQKGTRFGLYAVVLTGSIVSAGTGTLLAGIIAGVISTGGMVYKEYFPDEKLAALEKNFEIYIKIERLYNSFPEANFSEGMWSSQRYNEYRNLMAEIASLSSTINKKIIPNYSDEILTKKFDYKPYNDVGQTGLPK